MVTASTSISGRNVDPFGQIIKSSRNSAAHPFFSTSAPFGSPIGFQGKTTFGSIASAAGAANQWGESALASYSATPEVHGIDSRYSAGKIGTISAMPILQHKGYTFSIQNQGNAFQQSDSRFCPSTLSVPSSQFSFVSGGEFTFGTASAGPISESSVKPPFGGTGSVFGVSPTFGSIISIGDSNVDRAPRNSASGASSITVFGAPNNSGIDFNSTRKVSHSNSAHGSTSPIFGVSKVPPFATGRASSGFSTCVFGFPSTSVSEGSRTCVFQVSTTPGFGSRSTLASGSLSPPMLGSNVRNQCRGSGIAPYSETWKVDGASERNSIEKIQSISAMPIYQDKSHEELRSEDYELCHKGGHTPWIDRSLGSACSKTCDTTPNIFCFPPLSSHSSVSSIFHPSKSQGFITPTSTISIPPMPSPSVNPTSSTNLYPSQSQAFIPEPTVVSSKPTFSANLTPYSLTSFGESMPANSCQWPAMSTTFTSPSVSIFSPSKHSSTVSPSRQSTPVTALGPWPSFLNASKPGQTSEKVDSLSTNNLSQTSQAANGLTIMTDVHSQNINGQQYVSSSTVGMQSSAVANPFAMQSVIDRSNAVTSTQYGISSIPVSNKLSPNRRTSLLRIRHVSLKHNKLPAQRHSCGSSKPMVPFFSNREDRPSPIAHFQPRENPRAWVMNSLSGQEHTPLFSCADGKGCEDKSSPSSSFQLSVNPTRVTDETSIQEEDLSAKMKWQQDDDAAVIEKDEADILALMPKLPDGEYYSEPSINELAAKERAEPGCCRRVNDFVVGRRGYGCIKFLGETDVCHLNLESIIQFNNREVIVYVDDRKKPLVGQSLNKPAEITLLNVKCISKEAGKQYIDGLQVRRFTEMLIKKTAEQGAEFVSYDPVQGEWKFRVQHF